jgi:signal transduction histidine kinase
MSETILIVDDTHANLGVLVETLGAAGYSLMVAEDGEEALTQTAQTQPDLILLDVMMPGIDGFETCRRFKAQPQTADIPVLFMTALNETTDKVRAFAAGGVDYLTKPIEHEEALARVRTHLALRRLQRELQAEVALKDRFMRIASHDLRNPLCLILMAGELARRQRGAPESVLKYVANITDSASHMRRVIDTFLHLKRGDAARVELNLVAAAAVDQHQFAAAAKGISLTLEPAEAPAPIARCEPAHVFQAVTNFVSNALKFTPRGGTVTVRTHSADARVRCEVQDSGPGVRADERDQLFVEHGRLSPKPTGGEESHGVGLAIVKHLVESQGGAVGAEFPAGGGSVFWFELPAG